MRSHHDTLCTLRAAHQFPCPFVFKAIGPNTAELVACVVQVVVWVLGPQARPQVSLRASHRGRHLAVTLWVHVPRPEAVIDVYRGLRAIPGVRYLL